MLDEASVHELLATYMMIFGKGSSSNLTARRKVKSVVVAAASQPASSSLRQMTEYAEDALRRFQYAQQDRLNPFVHQHYSFSTVWQIVEGMVENYGMWQNEECRHMKNMLMALENHASGLVPLRSFYTGHVTEGATYRFAESVDYLREIGALDEAVP